MTLELEVGKTYLNRKGERVTIINCDNDSSFSYWDNNYRSYTKEGYYCSANVENVLDLIADVKDINTSHSTEDGTTKSRVEWIPTKVLLRIGDIFGFGGEKYYPQKWIKEPTSIEARLGSALRHIYKYKAGEKYDDESGKNHLDHAITQLIMASHYDHEELTDD